MRKHYAPSAKHSTRLIRTHPALDLQLSRYVFSSMDVTSFGHVPMSADSASIERELQKRPRWLYGGRNAGEIGGGPRPFYRCRSNKHLWRFNLRGVQCLLFYIFVFNSGPLKSGTEDNVVRCPSGVQPIMCPYIETFQVSLERGSTHCTPVIIFSLLDRRGRVDCAGATSGTAPRTTDCLFLAATDLQNPGLRPWRGRWSCSGPRQILVTSRKWWTPWPSSAHQRGRLQKWVID